MVKEAVSWSDRVVEGAYEHFPITEKLKRCCKLKSGASWICLKYTKKC